MSSSALLQSKGHFSMHSHYTTNNSSLTHGEPFSIENLVSSGHAANLTRVCGPSAFAVYCAVASLQGDKHHPFPSADTIAARAGVSVRTAKTMVHAIERAGYWTIKPRTDPRTGYRTSNVYVLRPLRYVVLQEGKSSPPEQALEAVSPDPPQCQELHSGQSANFARYKALKSTEDSCTSKASHTTQLLTISGVVKAEGKSKAKATSQSKATSNSKRNVKSFRVLTTLRYVKTRLVKSAIFGNGANSEGETAKEQRQEPQPQPQQQQEQQLAPSALGQTCRLTDCDLDTGGLEVTGRQEPQQQKQTPQQQQQQSFSFETNTLQGNQISEQVSPQPAGFSPPLVCTSCAPQDPAYSTSTGHKNRLDLDETHKDGPSFSQGTPSHIHKEQMRSLETAQAVSRWVQPCLFEEDGTDNPPKPSSRSSIRERTRERPSSLFMDWYRHYPRKVHRREAWRAWITAGLEEDGDLRAVVMADIETRCERDPDMKRCLATGDVQYIPHPASYLNGARWEDELELSEEWKQKVADIKSEYQTNGKIRRRAGRDEDWWEQASKRGIEFAKSIGVKFKDPPSPPIQKVEVIE